MLSSTAISNEIIMKKYIWMSRQLGRFNDIGSIVNWANAMSHVKHLLLYPLPEAPVPVKPLPSPSHSSSEHILSTNIHQKIHPDRSITAPITTCFKPTNMNPLTQSPSRCSNYIPSKPTLTINSHCHYKIFPSSALPRNPKRRKITIPPSVDNHASPSNHTNRINISHPNPVSLPTNTSTPSTNSSMIAPGMHIWHGKKIYPRGSYKWFWAFRKFNGADIFKILEVPLDPKNPITAKKMSTGKVFKFLLTDEKRLRI